MGWAGSVEESICEASDSSPSPATNKLAQRSGAELPMSTAWSPDPKHHPIHGVGCIPHIKKEKEPPHPTHLPARHPHDRCTQTHFSALFLAPGCCDKDPKQLRREPGVRGRRWAPPQHRAEPECTPTFCLALGSPWRSCCVRLPLSFRVWLASFPLHQPAISISSAGLGSPSSLHWVGLGGIYECGAPITHYPSPGA